MVYTVYCSENTVGETKDFYSLIPKAFTRDLKKALISKGSVESPPQK